MSFGNLWKTFSPKPAQPLDEQYFWFYYHEIHLKKPYKIQVPSWVDHVRLERELQWRVDLLEFRLEDDGRTLICVWCDDDD